MNEEANSPDSDDSFGFARRKSNFMDVRHNVRGGGTALLHSGDKKKEEHQNKDMSRTTPDSIAHSRHGGREPLSLVVGLSDMAASSMLSTSSDEEEEGDGIQRYRNSSPGTSANGVLLSLNTSSQLPRHRTHSASNSPHGRTRPLSSQYHADASIPADNGSSIVSLSTPFREAEHKQGKSEGCS